MGAGSIGSILTEKILKFNIKKLVVIDNNEYSIFRLLQEFTAKEKKKIEIKFLSILNYKLLDQIFKKQKFDYVYNCAAVKHVGIAENNKEETIRVNVTGTKNLLKLSKKYKISKFVFISSDKAIKPIGVMGKSKLNAEKLIINFKSNFQKKILRFPNVILSSGSLLEILYSAIINKKVFELKNKNLSRFFIFKFDACEFILRSTNDESKKNILILENVKEKKL